jgi:hypothetical protein
VELTTYDKMRAFELDNTVGLSISPRRPTYVINDRAIRQLVNQFDAIVNPTDDQIVAHLRSLQYRLMKNNFDNIN